MAIAPPGPPGGSGRADTATCTAPSAPLWRTNRPVTGTPVRSASIRGWASAGTGVPSGVRSAVPAGNGRPTMGSSTGRPCMSRAAVLASTTVPAASQQTMPSSTLSSSSSTEASPAAGAGSPSVAWTSVTTQSPAKRLRTRRPLARTTSSSPEGSRTRSRRPGPASPSMAAIQPPPRAVGSGGGAIPDTPPPEISREKTAVTSSPSRSSMARPVMAAKVWFTRTIAPSARVTTSPWGRWSRTSPRKGSAAASPPACW